MTDSAVVPTGNSSLDFGATDLDSRDFVPPRIKVVQPMSAERESGVEEGSFYNTLTGEDYGNTLRFVPILPFKNRVLLVRPERKADMDKKLKAAGHDKLPDGDGLMCRSLDMVTGIGDPGIQCGVCPLAEWEGRDIPPHCSETYNVAAITELGDLIILGFSKSGAKMGRRMFSMLRLSASAPWASIYEATTLSEKNDKGRFWIPLVKRVDRTPSELMKQALHFAGQLKGVVIDITPTDEEGEAPTGPAPWEEEAVPEPTV